MTTNPDHEVLLAKLRAALAFPPNDAEPLFADIAAAVRDDEEDRKRAVR
jgi:hypothetical protein